MPTLTVAPTPAASTREAPPVKGAAAIAPTATIPDVTSATISVAIFCPSEYFETDSAALESETREVSPEMNLSSSSVVKSLPVMFLYASARLSGFSLSASISSFIFSS